MRILLNPNRQHGSVLIVSLLISAILGVTLASYLIMMQTQNVAVARSQVWNSSITLTEAGVEDALALMNKYAGDYDRITNWSTSASIAADNWSALGANTYYVRRYLGNSYYDVYITNIDNTPVITSIGTMPWTYSYNNSSPTMLATVGLDQNYQPKFVRRGVLVSTKFDRLFVVAMAALRTINLNGKNVSTDSFDSADPNFSDNGLYPMGQVSKTKDNGDVVTPYNIIDTLDVGNARIKGSVKTGPNGTVAIGPGGAVGDRAWVESGKTGIQPGHSANDFNVAFPDVVMPSTTWLPVAIGYYTIDGLAYNYVFLNDGDYTVPGDFSNGIYVGTNAHVRLRITSSVTIMNLENDNIRIASGGSLQIYMLGETFKIAGRGVINDSGNASAFYLFGLPSCKNIQFNGNGSFTGAIYAPQADFYLGGGGNDYYDFVGSSVTKTVQMNGHFRFHYDENLRRIGPGRGYVATNWKEM